MKKILSISILLIIFSCSKELQQVDSIVTNAKVYTVNDNFDTAEAFAIMDGKFIDVGNSEDIQNKYVADTIIDAKGQTVVPGFIDAHCHFYGLGLYQQRVNLIGTESFVDVVKRVTDFQGQRNMSFIIGRGWDQNDWEEKEFPNNRLLDRLFPEIPVALTRIDGHAMLCNQAALDLANITKNTKIEGGEILLENGELTGVLIDNPMELVEAIYPKPTKQEQITSLLEAQTICTELGLTTVSDAGLDRAVIELIDR